MRLLIVGVLGTLLLAPPAVADPVGVGVGDTQGDVAAISLTGRASTTSGASFSALGNAENADCNAARTAIGCVAASGTGSARNNGGSYPCSPGPFVNFIALSGGGSATNAGGDSACGPQLAGAQCIAISAVGRAQNEGGYHGCGAASGYLFVNCVAVSGTGPAANEAYDQACASYGFLGAQMIAISGTGSAHNRPSFACVAGPSLGVRCLSATIADLAP